MRDARIGFDQLVQDFFLRRLIDQRGASARTVESYRDAFELLFGFIETRDAKSPGALTVDDLDTFGVWSLNFVTSFGIRLRLRDGRG
jgi:integrase/recombinase XerD